jgi:hypothetical protein
MTIFNSIIGSPAANVGIAILGKDGKISYLDNATSTARWNDDTIKLAAYAGTKLICGDNTNGVAMANGGKLSYLRVLGNGAVDWRSAAKALPDNIASITGDVQNGIAVVGEKGGVFQLTGYDDKGEWKPLIHPFETDLPKLIAGDKSGLLVVGGAGKDVLARSSPDCCTWTPLPKSPIRIDAISGNVNAGFVAYGEGQLFGLDAAKGVWTRLLRPSFTIVALSGNPKDGVVALLGQGDVVAYCIDPSKGPWCISQIVADPKKPVTAQQPEAEVEASVV